MNGSTYAYDAGLPCKNPNCRSNGRPHPSCRCYGGYAEGGEVSFCSQPRSHESTCEYYADGGSIAPDFDSLQDDSIKSATNPPPEVQNFDDLKADPASPADPHAPDFDSMQDDHAKYGSLPQQILTGVEGAAQGLAGPLATGAEKGLSALGVPGLSDEDIAGRAHENPVTHGVTEGGAFAASLAVPGLGEYTLAGKLAKAGEAAAQAAKFGKLGSAAIKGAITSGLFQGGDEVSKALLGQGGDPQEVMGSILAASTLGAVTGGLFQKTGEGLAKLGESKAGARIAEFLKGMGEASENVDSPHILAPMSGTPAYNAGVSFIEKGIPHATSALSKAGAIGVGKEIADRTGSYTAGNVAMETVRPYIEKLLKRPINGLAKYGVPAALKVLGSGDPESMGSQVLQAIDYGTKAGKGTQIMNEGVKSLFQAGGQQIINAGAHERDRKRLEDYIDTGGMQSEIQQPQGEVPQFAEGGQVSQPKYNFLEHNYPEQAMLHSAMRGRVSNYLTSLKPQKDMPKLAFDSAPNQSDKRRAYDKALDVAVNPMSVINHIKKGSLDTEHLKHLNNLYPELVGQLQKKVTEHISQAQLEGSKPPYKVRKSLSMFMGTPLDSTMTPSSIQAAQHVFQAKKADQQAKADAAAKKAKKGTSGLNKVAPSNMTPEQAREARAQTKT